MILTGENELETTGLHREPRLRVRIATGLMPYGVHRANITLYFDILS